MVERLRNSDTFISELSLVAEIDNQIVGYILLSKISVLGNNKNVHTSLSMAPVAVLQRFQGKGIGKNLIEFAHDKAKELGFGSVILLGHENYYPRFGYKLCKDF